jgi:pSer/pThr/pTyr-binding forkhead associated (FHA) protein
VFVDFDHGLNKAVSKLRDALGDDGSKPTYVETLPRRGYRFIAPVSGQSPDDVAGRVVARLLCDGKTISLSAGVHLIGRDERSAVRLDSTTVSRKHARLIVAPDATSLEDLHSKNGTRVEGRTIGRVTRLQDGDEIQIGSIALTIVLSHAKSTETAH